MDSFSRAVKGRRSRMEGAYFEDMILHSARYYENHGISVIDKTPEPMKVLKPYDRSSGKFIACFAKQAQPDFKGVLKDSTMILFDAKHTDTDRIRRDAVTKEQEECFERYQKLGAGCFLVVSLRFEQFYRVPWTIFRDMQKIYGHKYMSRQELSPYEIRNSEGVLRFLDGLRLREEISDEDHAV